MSKSYLASVDSIARDIKDECPDPNEHHNERSEAVTEAVDSSAWIIYYSNNEDVLNQTQNEPDAQEVAAMCKPDGDWKDIRQTSAYLAMECDVHEALRKLDKESESDDDN